jgi:hypothetical protein
MVLADEILSRSAADTWRRGTSRPSWTRTISIGPQSLPCPAVERPDAPIDRIPGNGVRTVIVEIAEVSNAVVEQAQSE